MDRLRHQVVNLRPAFTTLAGACHQQAIRLRQDGDGRLRRLPLAGVAITTSWRRTAATRRPLLFPCSASRARCDGEGWASSPAC